MEQTAMSVDDVEVLTGMNFFVNVSDDIEDRVEATYSLKDWLVLVALLGQEHEHIN